MNTALVIEDDEKARRFFSDALRPLASVVCEVGSVRDSRPFLKDLELDLIILDLVLPNGLGVEVIESLKRLRNDVPIVIVTGYKDSIIVEQGWPVTAILPKPCRIDELRAAIENALSVSESIHSIRSDTSRLKDMNSIDEKNFERGRS